MVETLLKSSEKFLDEAIDQIESDLGLDDSFDPSKWVSQIAEDKGLEKVVITFDRKKSFKDICKIVRDDMTKILEQDDNKQQVNRNPESRDEKDEFLELQHNAVIGDERAMGYFISKITDVLRTHNITSQDYPHFYESLAEAIFHEVWGVSILHKWERIPNSEACVIRGTQLWMDIDGKFVKQPEEFEDEKAVKRVRQAFTMRTKDAVINEQSPELEIEREDGSRITMIQKPRSRENYIMFRRFIVKDLSLYEQARLGTIKESDIDIFKALSRTMPNTIFAGRVRSAKSTFMKSMIRERDPSHVIAVIEKHFELGLSQQMPERLIFEVQAKEGDLHKTIPRLLRMEHDFLVIGEVRSLELEGYMMATERGERGAYSTYHLTDVKSVVPQLTRHILDEFPNRKFENELERIARNLDLIIIMSADRDRRRKRVIGVSEVVWEESTRTHYTNDLIRYSRVTDKYYYNSKITPGLISLMAEENLKETEKLVRLLREREKHSPMSEYEKISETLIDEILGEV